MKIWVALASGEFVKAFKLEPSARKWEKNYHALSKILFNMGFDLMSYELDEKMQEYFGMEMLSTAEDEIEIKEVNLE